MLLHSIEHMRTAMGRTDCQFVIVGDGTELPSLQRLAAELGINELVDFVGRKTGSDLWEILSTADVCVSPDRVNAMNDKSTMNKVIEYMALGKPVVQFDLTEGRHSAGDASVYAAADDHRDFALKLCELLDDPDRRSAMGK